MENQCNEVLVSISCLTYNHEPYIRKCLDSFLMQKTDFKFEIVIHDDASTDGTAEIIKEYQSMYPTIFNPTYQNVNQYSQGVKVMWEYNAPKWRGKYVAFCEGDDFWIDPLKLQKQVDFLEKNPDFSIVCHNAQVIYDDTKKRSRLLSRIKKNTEISMKEILNNWDIATSSIVFRKVFTDNYPKWHKDIYSGDFTLVLILMNYGRNFFLKDVMSTYRVNYSGTSATARYNDHAVFIWQQHINLLNYFDQFSNGIYGNIIKDRIEFLKNEIIFSDYKSKSIFRALRYMPLLFIKKIMRRIGIYAFNL